MRTAKGLDLRYSFYGNIYDTPYVSFNIEHNRTNLKETRILTDTLFKGGYHLRYTDLVGKALKDVSDPNDNSSRYFENVPKEIITSFLEKIKCSMANGNFNIPNILDFLNNESNLGIEYWDVVIEGGESKDYVQIDGLQNIRCVKRSIYYGTRNVVQISSRRRALSGSAEGKFALTKEQINIAEGEYRKSNEGNNTPLKAYFEYLPKRKPVFIIMPISPVPANTTEGKEEHQKLTKFREELGKDHIIAFAIGLPGVKGAESAVHYKINKVYQRLNVEDSEEEEIDDEE